MPSEYRFDEIEYFEFFYVVAGKRPSFELLGFGCKKANWLTRICWYGHDGFFPAETYSGISSYKLFELMEEARSLALKMNDMS